MTKKDYEKIAEVFRLFANSQEIIAEHYTVFAMANCMAAQLAEDNPRFNVDKFLKACGVV